MLRLRRGERMRRYFQPGLDEGKTFVFWGRNYNTAGIPGPERSRTWVNQPEKMQGSRNGTPHRNGQARFTNVAYFYEPDFTGPDYREGIVEESAKEVVFSFQTPYVIGATPPNNKAWGIYDDGCRNGLTLQGKATCPVSVSLDAGRTWSPPQSFRDGLDLTDLVKGRSHYWLRLGAGASQLRNTSLVIRTVCQANVAVLPRLKDNGTVISYEASGREVISMGPELGLAKSFVTAGGFGEKKVTLAIKPNRPVIGLHASAHVASGSPPNPKVRYHIEYSLDSGKRWLPLVKDRAIPRRGDEPGDFWSQSFSYGSAAIRAGADKPIQIRFRNDGGKRYLRAEAHLVQTTGQPDPLKVTYAWNDSSGPHQDSHVFRAKSNWHLTTGKQVRTHWVEFEPVY
jgi:hypothetical protein